MVNEQIARRGIRDERVLQAMRVIPRHLFLRHALWDNAYGDHPLSIGEGQTISQPYMVALMTGLLELQGKEKVLEVGTGSGYQAAILSQLAATVMTVERIKKLSESAQTLFEKLEISNVEFRVGDGSMGLEKEAPFDAIIVTAGSPDIPLCYHKQLVEDGRVVIPVGNDLSQTLYRLRRQGGKMREERFADCVFVKLIGRYGWSA